MKDLEELKNRANAEISRGEYLKEVKEGNNIYDTYFTLTHDLVKLLAIKKISDAIGKIPEEVANKYFIDGSSLTAPQENTQEDGNIETRNVNVGDSISLDDFKLNYAYLIHNAIESSKAHKTPSFLSLDGDDHLVLIAFIPKLGKPNEFDFVYMNSMLENPEDPGGCGSTGKGLFNLVQEYITRNQDDLEIIVSEENFRNLSVEQQIDNCCGLSVVSNITAIALNHSQGKDTNNLQENLFIPKGNTEEERDLDKREYYSKLGIELYNFVGLGEILPNINPILASKAEIDEGQEQEKLYKLKTPIQHSKELKIDQVNNSNSKILSFVIAAALGVAYLILKLYEKLIGPNENSKEFQKEIFEKPKSESLFLKPDSSPELNIERSNQR